MSEKIGFQAFVILHHKFRRLLPHQRLTIEIRKDSGVHQVNVVLHADLPGEEPVVGNVNGHGLDSHHRRFHIVGVQIQRNMLAYKGIRTAGNEERAFFLLRLDIQRFYCLDISGQLRIQGIEHSRIRFLRPCGQK